MATATAMAVVGIPKMSAETLEKILRHLPNPSNAYVYLGGDFDYSSAYNQVKEVLPELELSHTGLLECRIENPTKKEILDAYKREREQMDSETPLSPRYVTLKEINWYLDEDKGRITLTPTKVSTELNGPEPDYLKELKKDLEGSGAKISITTHNLY